MDTKRISLIPEERLMKQAVRLAALAVLAAACALRGAPADTAKGKATIDKKADDILKKACAHLAKLKSFRFQVDETVDEVTDDGQKLQFSNHRTAAVRRPARVRVQSTGDTVGDRQFYYNGKTITLYDKAKNTYTTLKAPRSLDAMIEELHTKHGQSQPLADLLFADPYKVLTEKVTSGGYVGLHKVDGVKCHHLAFRQSALDWQIWIDSGDKPLVRKLVITFKRDAASPQYCARLHHWEEDPDLPDSLFQFKAPKGAKKVPLPGTEKKPKGK
jgi:hypothetical protein